MIGLFNFMEGIFPGRSPKTGDPTMRPTGGSTDLPDFEYLWANCTLDQDKITTIRFIAKKIILHRLRYEVVQDATGIPWYLVGALNFREGSGGFSHCFHNGDKLPGPTRNVPAGRGPFASWEDSAIDAIKLLGFHHLKITTPVQAIVIAEKFNGMGYRKKGIYSPYLWAGTNWSEERGKYIADGKWDPNAPEKQIGVAAIMKEILNHEP